MSKNIKTIIDGMFPVEQNWKLKLLSNWATILGNLNTKVYLEKIAGDTLVLSVPDSCWLQELYLLSPMLLQHINSIFDKPHIKQLKFKKAGLPAKKKDLVKKSMHDYTTQVHLTSREENALAHIKDHELAHALKKFLIRCHQEK